MPALGPQPGGAQEVDLGNRYINQGKKAAASNDFGGTIEVSWAGPDGTHRDLVEVRSADGLLLLGDDEQVVVQGSTRYAKDGDRWITLWGRAPAALGHTPSEKWELTVRGGPLIAGRATREVAAAERDTGQVRERRYFDAITGLQLRREQFDTGGRRVRSVSFVELTMASTQAAGARPRTPRSAQTQEPDRLESVGAEFDAPETIGNGFYLNGAYDPANRDGVQLFYSDGLFVVSVFEEKGSLDRDALESGGVEREIAGHTVHEYVVPSGTVHVWETEGLVYTAVSDAPSDEVEVVVASFGGGEQGLVERVGDFVLGPFGW